MDLASRICLGVLTAVLSVCVSTVINVVPWWSGLGIASLWFFFVGAQIVLLWGVE